MRILFVLSICFFSNISIDAQAELVHEFFPGSDGTTVYTEFMGPYNQATSVKLASDVIIFSAKGISGQELYKIDNGELSLIKDLKTGEENSTPQFLTIFEGIVYFIAEGDQGARIYKTDGTEEGTQVAFDLGNDETNRSDFSEFLVGRDGRLYFEFESNIYTYQNGILTTVNGSNPITVGSISYTNNNWWALYKEGVVVFDFIDGVLLSIIDNKVTELAEIPNGFVFALESFEGGVFFSIEASGNLLGDYIYLESTDSVTKIAAGNGFPSTTHKRSEYLGDNACVVSGFNSATYLFNNANPTGIEIHDKHSPPLFSNGRERERLADGLLFLGASSPYPREVLFIEQNSNTASLVHTTADMSPMKTDGSYTFYFAESELGDKIEDEDLFSFNHSTKEVTPIKTLFDTPVNTNITPIGVIGQDLYFFGIMDNNVGLELYKINIGFSTSTEGIEEIEEISLTKEGNNQYAIKYDFNGSINVEIRSVDGRLIEKISTMANTTFEIRERGIILVSVDVDGRVKTFKVFN